MEEKKFRELNKNEQKAVFALYKKHLGNITAITKDKDCKFKNRNQLAFYRDNYDWDTRLQQITAQEAENFKKKWQEKLENAKRKAIEKAIVLLSPRIVLLGRGKNQKKVKIQPDPKEIETAYKIIKTELGEPTNIARNENVNEDNVRLLENHREDLDKLINNAKTETTTTKPDDKTGEPASV